MTTITRAQLASAGITVLQRAWLLAVFAIVLVVFIVAGAIAGAAVALEGAWREWKTEWRCA